MDNKIKVGILCGGKSAEHEVSIESANNVMAAINKDKYEPSLILIDKQGKWLTNSLAQILAMDVIFPVLHGPYGEDGTMQGFLKLANKPFVGAGVLGSAVGMDKDIMKRLLREARLPIGKFIALETEAARPSFDLVKKTVGLPCFIKPANMGSSVGIHKVETEDEYYSALEDAFLYDTKILIEEFIAGREIECAVLGNHNPKASVVGEIKVKHDFYSYEAKYLDDAGADLIIPAQLSPAILSTIQKLAIETFKVLSCSGLARVDFFLRADNEVIINEINTIPGFTKISMYPKLWQVSGIEYQELIDQLIELAMEKFQKEEKLKNSISQ
jgi:D-alanine-D-alanine ligase